jgi:HK97 family phage major capsid protein
MPSNEEILKGKLDTLGVAFEEFKKINNAKVEAEKSGREALAKELGAKSEKAEAHIQSLETKITELNAALARTAQGGAGPEADVKEYRETLRKNLGREVSVEETKEFMGQKKRFNEFMRKGKNAAQDGAFQVESKTLSADSQVDGGFFIEPEVSSEIVKKINLSSPIRQLASVISISTSSFKINSDTSARTANWQGERSSRSEGTNPQVNQDEIFVHEMDCNPGATQTFLDDAAVNVEAWLADYAAEAFALAEATAFVSGHGVGRPRGFLSYADGSSYGQVQRIATDATGAITGDDLIDLQDALKSPYRRGATWLMHRTIKSLVRKVKDGTQYLWQPGLVVGSPDVIMGNPVMEAEDMSTSLATTADGLIAYGDFKQGYQIVDRVGIRVLRDPYSSKPKVVFFTTKRVGGGVKNYEAIKVLKIG